MKKESSITEDFIIAKESYVLLNYCQAQFQLASSVKFSRTEICLISDNYYPHPQDSSDFD